MTATIRKCDIQDLKTLRDIGIETFNDTFAAQNKPENMRAYLAKAFDEKKLQQELNTPNSSFFFISHNNQLAGFLKVNVGTAQSEPMGDNSLEVERIYVRRSFKRMGLGKKLMNYAFELAEQQHKTKIWLGVWEKNTSAVLFYEQQGFVLTDKHSFWMGDDEQIDWIMTKSLT
ncbi:GNAT family N-acetyltransferase [Saccharibacillus endophyticus]|uniref:Spermidine/spermine N(1)-acetyltransferase n=1 Tax=Saccharibacillus endophyticus TaxID=2060666 RepID=A0ABQ2A8H3_9BACL|nr:GNAT family N-acetyltransferase [Saccharibacillus endophyticus]GGH85920.1 spermidine/spermine N(1)-acetyltransferase [Saccharibacillus endophyticus]